MVWYDKRKEVQNNSFKDSFKHAADGIVTSLKEEPNLKKDIWIAIAVTILGLIVKLSLIEWMLVGAAIVIVMSMEMMNTAVENLVDLVTNYQYHPLAKKVKDIAAGAVLMVTVFAVLVGLLVFIPKLI